MTTKTAGRLRETHVLPNFDTSGQDSLAWHEVEEYRILRLRNGLGISVLGEPIFRDMVIFKTTRGPI